MEEFDLVYKNIRLRVECDKYIEKLVNDHLLNHITFNKSNEIPTYSIVIGDNIKNTHGLYYRMVDKWFNNATLDCYIDNKNKICYATNFYASSDKYKNLLIQYFISNVFNRFLEMEGYLGVHSSCVEENNNGVLFVAGRYSGKTNCMLNMMNDGFNCVTNDKIALKKIDNSIIGYGIAQSISIRLGPSFCSQSQNKKYVDIALKRGIDIKCKDMVEGNSIELTDNEVARLNKVKQVLDTPIKCIIRPFYDPNIERPTFGRLTEEQLIELINSQYMPLVHDTTDFLREIKINGQKDIDKRITLDSLLDVPSYVCHQNEKTREEFVDKVKKLIMK